MRQIPLFDTNVFGHVQSGKIPLNAWKYVLRKAAGKVTPLSSITALELLAALDATPPSQFLNVKQLIAMAYNLCDGRVLEDPRFLLCKEILHIPFPPEHVAPAAAAISRHMDIIRHANSLNQLLSGVPYRGRMARMNSTAVITNLMAGPKNDWRAAVERMADEYYPEWRAHFQRTGNRLPPEKRKEIKPRSAWHAQRQVFSESLLNWLGTTVDMAKVDDLSNKLDAALEFTIFVAREFLVKNYSLEKHNSDVFDQFQLHYLALDRFVIVSEDPDMTTRIQQSPQKERIMSFDQFISTL